MKRTEDKSENEGKTKRQNRNLENLETQKSSIGSKNVFLQQILVRVRYQKDLGELDGKNIYRRIFSHIDDSAVIANGQ